MTYSFHSAARLEHLDNVVFYESRLAGLGREYLMAFEAADRRLQEHSEQHGVVLEPDVRRYRMTRFPFWII